MRDIPITVKSPSENLLTKMDRRDKAIRALELFILFSLVIFSVFTSIRLQQVVDQNQRGALERAADATRDRQEQKDYIKCIILLRFVVPPEALQTYDGTEEALDT